MVMMKKMIRVWILFFVVALLVLVCGEAVTIGEKCSNDFTKVATCLTFATGKSDTPTKQCCTSVTEIKQSEPECLCYIIQQTHRGSPQVKSMGIQESRLLHLPSACKLTNASVSDCPKLLNIPSTSPDYAIFTNSSSPTSPSTVTGTSSPSIANDSSETIRTEHVPQLIGLVTIAMAIFLLLSPVEVMSTFCM
ncbi:Non-specific lipid transfer protein GPI-anchored 1 [Camellia lanceoleosa]|uniref:Non-specific lipid transfer protein GPI-anchored 1 n=1 Tax=Camellia lanceoleosa TaxID=1840588 RepID=A0ACC0ICG0_9ERIC|nr:Non-specific lipid transfer protein GPI-anchored 1 [Camellia lanceoleosa]